LKGGEDVKRIKLKIAVLKTGYTNREFAQKIKMNPCKLSSIMSGKYNPSPEEKVRIMKSLKCNDDIFAIEI